MLHFSVKKKLFTLKATKTACTTITSLFKPGSIHLWQNSPEYKWQKVTLRGHSR